MAIRRIPRQSPVIIALLAAACMPRAAVPPPSFARYVPSYTPVRPVVPTVLPPLRQVMLAAHAQARARVGLPPLLWSDTLAARAQGWADALARSGGFRHAALDDEGENLWMGTRGAYSYAEMARDWIAEARRFPPHGGFSAGAGHYSQIVWRETRRIGCALASNRRDDVLVCRYDPPGNVIGEAAY